MCKIIKTAILTLAVNSIVFSSCSRLVEIPESNSQTETQIVFADSSSAVSALLGAYVTLGTSVYGNIKYLGLYSDEYNFNASGQELEYRRSRLISSNGLNTAWGDLYLSIYQCNAVIEESSKSTVLTGSVKSMLIGEAKFLRAFANFYLVNFYDHIPLVLTTNVSLNKAARQSTVQQVYDQIIKDLLEAKADLGNSYQGQGKVRANKWAASALLSRVYLYLGNWIEAEKEASLVINSGNYSPLTALESVFLANSKETILQLWNQNGFVVDAAALIPSNALVIPQYTIAEELYNSFDPSDERLSKWISTNEVNTGGVAVGYHYPSKYKNRTANTAKPEYAEVLRLAEQYLIRAEARAQLNDVPAAVVDLNIIRIRASGLTLLNGNVSKSACLEAIAKERRLELFGEWGHRFLDLKRTGKLDEIIGKLKPTWKTSARALPIPQNEIIYNSNLIQNNGY